MISINGNLQNPPQPLEAYNPPDDAWKDPEFSNCAKVAKALWDHGLIDRQEYIRRMKQCEDEWRARKRGKQPEQEAPPEPPTDAREFWLSDPLFAAIVQFNCQGLDPKPCDLVNPNCEFEMPTPMEFCIDCNLPEHGGYICTDRLNACLAECVADFLGIPKECRDEYDKYKSTGHWSDFDKFLKCVVAHSESYWSSKEYWNCWWCCTENAAECGSIAEWQQCDKWDQDEIGWYCDDNTHLLPEQPSPDEPLIGVVKYDSVKYDTAHVNA